MKGPLLIDADSTVYCESKEEHDEALRKYVAGVGDDVEVDWEYSGSGKYRFQRWCNRPEGLDLISLKWEGV